MKRGGYTYVISNFKRSVFYVGVTSDIVGRIWEHKNGVYENSFSKRYKVTDLVFWEYFDSIVDAIDRETEIKGWGRMRKINLILTVNPQMKDLYTEDFIKDNYT